MLTTIEHFNDYRDHTLAQPWKNHKKQTKTCRTPAKRNLNAA